MSPDLAAAIFFVAGTMAGALGAAALLPPMYYHARQEDDQ